MTSSKVLLLLCALAVCSVVAHEDHDDHVNCRHDHIEHNPEFLDVDEDFPEPDEEGRRLASASNIRIYPYYSLLGGSSSYNSYWQYKLVPPVVSFFEGALRVKYPVSGKLKVTTSTVCGKSTPSVLRNGVPADYFIFFTTTSDSGSWIAESTACFLATGTNRPLVSNTLINRNLLKDAGSNVLLHEKNTYLLLHEMTHTFGFSYSLYKYFLDSNGRQRSGHIKSQRLDGATSVVIDVSPLTSRLRNHFGCSSLAGAYMENSGSTATAGSHFERRQFGYEALTSGLTYHQRYSEFSLAMLEGSGWYVPNYNYAEPFFFGQGQGCTFLTGSCSSNNARFDDFCNNGARGCAPQGITGGTCRSDTRSDNCKFIQADVNYDCQNPGASSYARLSSLQSFGRTANSQCFAGTLSTKSSDSTTSFCFKYSCSGSGSGTVVNVQVGGQTVTCRDQGSVSVSGYKGTITCPDPLAFCQSVGKAYCPRNCMGRGNCNNGKCSCYSGYSGIDCGL